MTLNGIDPGSLVSQQQNENYFSADRYDTDADDAVVSREEVNNELTRHLGDRLILTELIR